MRSHHLTGRTAALALALAACGGGDLTLPGPNQPGAPQPASLQVVSGDGQEGAPGDVLGDPLAVRVLDDSARPLAGAAIRFSFQGDVPGASLEPDSALTGADGSAAATVRLGDSVGEQVVVAQVIHTERQDLQAMFTATAVAPSDGGGGKGRHHHGE